ncbi:short-chain dehydrogenase [Burkholderia multivorans]|uniref:SDR family NAD(P)-dependent oxidoreductase n=1 Tax=Burkholderia multivorans TaxID=87883 RepID=UPI000D007DD2|nr:SDR family NAD(P)-dependent oxidoreductase [Burkholderia multivorans]MDN7954003.1 SDR family NAD(P)-dependent oxidoreductase [Burkholderia multivorans]PRG67558.1 short-chain dehydrogenase [Burkholderia multivorans]
MESFSLEGRTAVVTGGSTGIGRSIVELFTTHGAKVLICHHRDEDRAAAFAETLSRTGANVAFLECDVTDEGSVAQLGNWTRRNLGSVDILVNGAGICGEVPFSNLLVEQWDQMMAVNLRGAFLVTRQFFDGMKERRYGRIINIASQLAYKGTVDSAHYCASKAGLVGFTRALSYEAAPYGVTVNAIAPGPVETAMLAGFTDEWRAMKFAQLPAGRFGQVDEIAPTALLLASETGGAYFIGQTLSPNGGDVML